MRGVQAQIMVDISSKLEQAQYGVPYVMYVEEVPVLKKVVPTEHIATQRQGSKHMYIYIADLH